MNTHKYLKPYAIVPVTMDAIRDLVELGKQQADRIAELEKKLQESAMNYISICSQADEHYARVKELEKDLHMIQRHYDQLKTFSPSGNNAEYVGNTNETLPKGKE